MFDHLVSPVDTPTAALAVTGLDSHGATIADFAGNGANLSPVTTSFPTLTVNDFSPPAFFPASDFHLT